MTSDFRHALLRLQSAEARGDALQIATPLGQAIEIASAEPDSNDEITTSRSIGAPTRDIRGLDQLAQVLPADPQGRADGVPVDLGAQRLRAPGAARCAGGPVEHSHRGQLAGAAVACVCARCR